MLQLLAAIALAQAQSPVADPSGPIFSSPSLAQLAFFEFAPTSGMGMGTACACTTPTGAKGEALTFTRASNGTCTKGNPTTGIQNGDLVVCSTNQPRVGNPDGLGLALLVESAATNSCIRSAELCNAAWTDTAACASDQIPGPFGTTTAELLTDSSGAAHQGATQLIATTSQTKHTWSCYLKAGTATTAELSFTGTGNSAGDNSVLVTDLSSTTWTRGTVTSSAAYGAGITAVTAKVLVGADSTATGTIYVEGCDYVVASTYATSHIPTTTVAVTGAADAAYVTLPTPIPAGSPFSIAASASARPDGATNRYIYYGSRTVSATPRVFGVYQYTSAKFLNQIYDGTNSASATVTGTSALNHLTRTWQMWDGVSVTTVGMDGTSSASATQAVSMSAIEKLRIGGVEDYIANTQINGYIRQVCVDPSPTRCR